MIRFWNEEMDGFLRANKSTMSLSAIAKQLGTTRGAVVGRAYRLGLCGQPRPRKPPAPKAARVVTPRKPRTRRVRKMNLFEFASVPMPIAPLNIPLFDLEEHHCREVTGTGDYGVATFCGHPKMATFSYCQFHSAINYEARRGPSSGGFILREFPRRRAA